jgi:hypothetical protein
MGLEDEYNSAFVKLEDDHSQLRERIVVVNEQRENLTKIISDYQENTKYVVELCRYVIRLAIDIGVIKQTDDES